MSVFAWIGRWLVSLLVWLSSDPHQIATEPARSSAAVSAAVASMAAEVRDNPVEVVPQ